MKVRVSTLGRAGDLYSSHQGALLEEVGFSRVYLWREEANGWSQISFFLVPWKSTVGMGQLTRVKCHVAEKSRGRGCILRALAVTSVGDGMAHSPVRAHRPHAVPFQAPGSPGREMGGFPPPRLRLPG